MRSGDVLACLSKERVHELARQFDVEPLRSNESAKSLASGIARSLGARLGWQGSLRKVLTTLTADELRIAAASVCEATDRDGNPFTLYRPAPPFTALTAEDLGDLVSELPGRSVSLNDAEAVAQLRRLLDSGRWRACFEYVGANSEPRKDGETELQVWGVERITDQQKKSALKALETPTLRGLLDATHLTVVDRKNRDHIIEEIIGARTIAFSKLISILSRDDLKAMCRALGLPDDGKEKSLLVARVCDPGDVVAPTGALENEDAVARARRILSLLKREELQHAADDFEVRITDKRSVQDLVRGIVEAGVSLSGILDALPRARLKEICRVFDLDESGREKGALIRRLVGEIPEKQDTETAAGFEVETAAIGRANLNALQNLFTGVLQVDEPGTFWPARARLAAGDQEVPIDLYARVIGGTGRNAEERRFQNPGGDARIEPHVGRTCILLGAWLEAGIDRTVLVAFDAYRRAGKSTRFSLFMPLALLEKAADTGFATHVTASGETLYAFRPDSIARYLDIVADRAPPTERNGSQAATIHGTREPSAAPLTAVGVESVEIRPKAGMFAAFARLNYKPWFALAELVDNAVQSFLSNRKRLAGVGFVGPLVVDVNIDDHEISVLDRAAGISLQDFPRAFSPATPPPDAAGLSEFGLGMKAAASWFAREWSVRTSALGESVERTISFDVPRITREGLDNLPIETREARTEDHFTVVTMRNLRVHPKGSTLAKIKDHLASIYRLLIADGTLRIRWTHAQKSEDLTYEQPKLLDAPFYKDRNGAPVLWKKEISIDMSDNRRVAGWVGIMETGKHSRAGLSVFRRNRLIEGSVGEAYRPRQVFGAHNSFASQRVVGELYVEGFDVTHTKDGIQWGDAEEDVAYELRMQLTDEKFPLLDQAEGYRSRRDAAHLPADFGEKAMESTVIAAVSEEVAETIAEYLGKGGVEDEGPVHQLKKAEATLQERTFRIQVPGNKNWDVRLELTRDSLNDWLDCSLVQHEGAELMQIRINLDHEFSIEHINDNQRALNPLLLIAVAIGIAERQASLEGVKSVGAVRRHLNELLRRGLSKAPVSVVQEVDQ